MELKLPILPDWQGMVWSSGMHSQMHQYVALRDQLSSQVVMDQELVHSFIEN